MLTTMYNFFVVWGNIDCFELGQVNAEVCSCRGLPLFDFLANSSNLRLECIAVIAVRGLEHLLPVSDDLTEVQEDFVGTNGSSLGCYASVADPSDSSSENKGAAEGDGHWALVATVKGVGDISEPGGSGVSISDWSRSP